MKRFHSPRLLTVAVMAGCASLSVVGPLAADAAASAVTMASHHATYKLTLLTAKGSNAPASASGLIDYSFAGSDCDGYTTTFRQMTEMQPTDGDSKLNDMRSTTFEDAASTQFTFKTKTTTDEDTVADLDGRAQKAADGSVSVDLKHPAGKANFGQETLFPTEHLRRVIGAAEKGEKLLSANVYDGSETGKKIYRTLSVIGAAVASPPSDAAGQNDVTKAMRRWPVVISYFQDQNEDQPDYVLSFDLYENGISRALKLDYGDFVLAGSLVNLSVTPASACRK